MNIIRSLSLFAGLLLLVPSVAQADAIYRIQPLVRLGDTVENTMLRADGALHIGTLNDNGDLVFVADGQAGGQLLVRYADKRLNLLVNGGGVAPGGTWPANVKIYSPVGMNQQGSVAFNALITVEGKTSRGTFRWDPEPQKTTAVALPGMPAGQNVVIEGASEWQPAINNRSEIAFQAQVKNTAGKVKEAVFLATPGLELVPVALPGLKSPSGALMGDVWLHSFNDAGVIAFSTGWEDRPGGGGHLWEKGEMIQVSGPGTTFTKIPSNPPSIDWAEIWVNNHDRTVLLWTYHPVSGRYSMGLLRGELVNETLTPVVVPGQKLPDGRKLVTVDWVSAPNEAGHHAFIARLEDKSDAVYLLDPDGTITPLLRSGTTTDIGTITKIHGSLDPSTGLAKDRESSGLGLNSSGQIALVIQLDNGPDTIVLLTPVGS